MKQKLVAICMFLLIVATLSAADSKQKTKEKTFGVIRDLACFSCKTNIGTLAYLILNPIGIKVFEVSITLGCTVVAGDYQMCLDHAVAYTAAIMNNFKIKTFEANYRNTLCHIPPPLSCSPCKIKF